MTIPVARKQIKAFKKRHDDEPDLGGLDSNDEQSETEDGQMGKE